MILLRCKKESERLSDLIREKEDPPMQSFEEPFHFIAYRRESGMAARALCAAIGSSVNNR